MSRSKLLAFGVLLFALNCPTLPAESHLTTLFSNPQLDGFITTVPTPGVVCAPAPTDTTSELQVGKNPSDSCGETRSYLSFDLSSVREGQIAKAELFLYQAANSGDADPPEITLTAELVDYGLNLDASDWSISSLATVASGVSVGTSAYEYRIDVTALINFVFETGRSRFQVRLRCPQGPNATSYLTLYSGDSTPAELRPRVDVTLTQPVVSPLRLEPPFASTQGSGYGSGSYIGIALANPGNPPNRAKTTRYSTSGDALQIEDRGLITRNGQSAFVADPAGQEAMMVAKGNVGALQGFFMLGDDDLRRLDGVGGQLVEADTLYIPVARQGTTTDTQVYLFRSTSTLDQDVELALFDTAGNRLVERTVRMTSPGFLSGPLATLLDTAQRPERSYVRILSTAGVQALAVFSDRNALGSLAAVTPSRSKRLYAPHFLVSQEADSELSLLNLEDNVVDARIRAYGDDGTLLGQATLQLASHGLLSQNLSEVLSLDPPAGVLLTGHVEIEMDPSIESGQYAVLGAIAFGAKDGSYLSVLPLLGRGSEDTLLLQVAQSDPLRIFTGLAILNYGDETAHTQVQAFGKTGLETASSDLTLGPGMRSVGLLNTAAYFGPGFTQVGGHLRITSDQPIITFAIFGDFNLRYLAAVESQPPSAEFDGISVTQEDCETNRGPSLVSWNPDPRKLGPPTLLPQQPSNIQLVFWDNTEEASSLGGIRLGVGDVEWDLSELEALGVETSTSLEVGFSLYSVRSRLDFDAPEGAAGRARVKLKAIDVAGCSTTIAFPVIVGKPEP